MNRDTVKHVYDWFMLTLSLYVVVVLALSIVADWREEIQQTLDRGDTAICVVFLADWFYFLVKAENKRKYVFSHFVDLVASIPYVEVLRAFRIARAVRIVRALRLLRGLKGAIPLVRTMTKNRMRSALAVYVSATTVVFLYCSLGVYNFERGINTNVKTYSDALWMCFTTMTSVGYGDMYPVTGGGRLMAVMLVITGLGLFSLVTAEFATWFIGYLKSSNDE